MKYLPSILKFVVFISVMSCASQETETAENSEEEHGADSVVSLTDGQIVASEIQTGKIEERVLSGTVSVSGMLDVPPQNLVVITAPLGGFLRSTSLLQGMHVKKGDLIAVIENPEYIEVQQQFLDSKSQLEFLESEYKRQVELSKESVNSTKTLQKSQADFNSMKAKYDGLQAKLKMLKIDPEKFTPGMIRSTIELRSPIDGYVTQINASIGAFAGPTETLFRIVDTDHLHAELIVFERDLPKVKIGQTIRFTLANETKERKAKIYLIGREIASDRTVRVHGHIDLEDGALIPGMYLKALIETQARTVKSLPEAAVLNFEDRKFVFVRDATNPRQFQMVEVQTGLVESGYIEVLLPEGGPGTHSEIVVKNAYKLLSKMKNSETDEHGH